MPKYSLSPTRKIYEVLVEHRRKTLARITIDLRRPKLNYLILSRNGGPEIRLRPGSTYRIEPGDRVRVTRILTNITANRDVEVKVEGAAGVKNLDADLPDFEMSASSAVTLRVQRRGVTLGKIVLTAG
jgi:hypothetical protein